MSNLSACLTTIVSRRQPGALRVPRKIVACAKPFSRLRRLGRPGALWLCILGLNLAGCGGGNSLGGSMDTVFSLDFSAIEITYRQTSLVVQYTNGADVVCSLIINTQATPVVPNATISGAPFVQTVSLYRAAAAGGSFPDVANGALVLGAFGATPGSSVSGHFNATLADAHTLIGAFDGVVKFVVQ